MRTRILPKMLNSEVQEYLKRNDIIIVPVGTVEMHGGLPLDVETVGKLRHNRTEKIQHCQRPHTGRNKDVIDVFHHKRCRDTGTGRGQPFSAQSAPSGGLGMSGDKETVRQNRKMPFRIRVRGLDHVKIHHIAVHSKCLC